MSPIFRIIAFTSRFWKWYLFMGIFVITTSLLSLVIPILSKYIVDIIVAQIGGQTVDFSQFVWLLVAIIATDVGITVLTATSQWVGDILAVRLQTFLSKKFYHHILNLHIGYYDQEITGKIVNKMYRGISSITEFIQSMLNNFLPFFLTALVTVILLSYYSLAIGLLLAILFPLYILISHGSTKAWGKYEERKNILNDLSQGRVFESISGIRVVKSFAGELHELAAFLTKRKEIERLTLAQTKKWHWYDFIRRLALNSILFAIYSYIVYFTYARKFTLGEMTLLLQLVNQARFPLFAMSFILGQIQQANSGSNDFFKVLATKTEIIDRPYAQKLKLEKQLPLGKKLITFTDVSFAYEKGNTVLKDMTFPVYSGEKLALVGESGQGKSTLVNLLLRYYEPERGVIAVNGHNIAHITQESLHTHIAVVFQESLLFSGSILENIRYGKPGATRKEVQEAAVGAYADEFIQRFPDGYDSLIGERGVKLSGGQKQRIAIARAMLKDAPIIILDEATSSLDSKSEILVQKGLDRLLHHRTSLIIAHRLSTIANADHILVIAGGRIVQYGTTRQLLVDKDGFYAKLISLQKDLLRSPSEAKQDKLKEFDLVG